MSTGRHFIALMSAILSAASLFAGGCTGKKALAVDTATTSYREIDDEPVDPVMDKPSVRDFHRVCDTMARRLSEATVFQGPGDPVVVEIRPIEDNTGQGLDVVLYLRIVREKLLNMGHGRIAFRDEQIRDDIIDERIDQSAAPVRVRKTESSELSGRRRTSRSGRFTGPGGTGTPIKVDEEHKTTTKKVKDTEVSSGIAEVDYFLTGFVSLQDERPAGQRDRGQRYYRFQFRLSNARTGIIHWEWAEHWKREGLLRE